MMRSLLALDRSSVRSIDANGFMKVAISPLTREQVAPYYGHEIPGWQDHKLDPDAIYYGYRPAAELSAPETLKSVEGLPIHVRHHADFADAPAKETRVGATGTDAKFEAPYLMNSLHIWDKTAQDAIKSGLLRELSLAYHYDPEFTPGEFKGQKYDFIMRHLRGNHLALVEEGRAGADVLVYDSKSVNLEELGNMADIDKLAGLIARLDARLANIEQKIQKGTPAADDDPAAEPFTAEEKATLLKLVEKGIANGFFDALNEDEDAPAVEANKSTEDVCKDADDQEDQKDDQDLTAMDEWEPDEDENKIINDAGYGDEPIEIQRAFADGVKYGEKVEKNEPEKIDADHERTGELKALGEDAAIKKLVRALKNSKSTAQKIATAISDCRSTLGNVKVDAFDSAADVYVAACAAEGLRASRSSARDVYLSTRGQKRSAPVSVQSNDPIVQMLNRVKTL